MSHKLNNPYKVPAIVMNSIEVAGVLDEFPYCELCGESAATFMVFPGLREPRSGVSGVYCPTCGRAYMRTANLSRIERGLHKARYEELKALLGAHGLWE